MSRYYEEFVKLTGCQWTAAGRDACANADIDANANDSTTMTLDEMAEWMLTGDSTYNRNEWMPYTVNISDSKTTIIYMNINPVSEYWDYMLSIVETELD